MDPVKAFEEERKIEIEKMGKDDDFRLLSRKWLEYSVRQKYSYNFKWMGRPVIQYPQDLIALQEIIWQTKPDLIVETGIAHGGSLIFHASILELIGGEGRVLGIDIDIRAHNKSEIESHPMYKRIDMLEGSSIDKRIVDQVYKKAEKNKSILVILDSMHTHEHVLEELKVYSPLVKNDGYLVVLDTLIEFMPSDAYPDRPWGPGNNPSSAVQEFLQGNKRFVVDKPLVDKLQITVSPDGYLRCISD